MECKCLKDMRFGVKYLPRNDLYEHELHKILCCDWPSLRELRLSIYQYIEGNHLEDERKEYLNFVLLLKFSNFMCIDHFSL